ncbi:MAG TPA: prolyl oligopeptidase family serine peptidase [Polyangiaceae bacterium]|nr:prolyl oligopeptidase family serine peptidase [Polyangiaceae bacterium]
MTRHTTPSTPAASASPPVVHTLRYPDAPRGEQHDEYHGVVVADPYRWLEAMDSPETRRWIDAENALTAEQFAKISVRAPLERRLRELWNYERWSAPTLEGARLIFAHNDGLQNQAVLYTQSESGEKMTLLDPNALSKDGTVALSSTAFSNDGRKMAYGLAEAGSDWQTWRVRDVHSASDAPHATDVLHWIKFSGASWSHDDKGFYYSRFDEPKSGAVLTGQNYHQKVYYHRLGQPQSADTLVYARPDHKEWGFGATVSEDGRWLVLTVTVGTNPKNCIFVQDLRAPAGARKTVELLPGFTAKFDFVGNEGDTLWFLTDDSASRRRVIAIDVHNPDKGAWRELIAEGPDTIESVSAVADRLIVTRLENAHTKVTIHRLDGALERELALPGIGTAGGFSGKLRDRETYFWYSGFSVPAEIWKLEVQSGKTSLWRRPRVAFDPAQYETSQVWYRSADGTEVPMFLCARKGLQRNAQTPTYLYGYGGFEISLTPSFSVPNLVWMELGGLLAVPNLRGGGEFGASWHDAGTKLHKQNVFDDFIAAAEYLIKNGYTQKSKLSIGGRSNGGLLVGAAITQRPDLFGAALPGVGVLDMLRFNQFTIGWAWESDYGSPNDPAEFAALRAYSPYHNLKSGTAYPATLIYTADHDDRVVPLHSYKFAAALQHAQAGPAPILIRIDTKAGHGAGKPTNKQIEEWADLWGFLVEQLAIDSAALAR